MHIPAISQQPVQNQPKASHESKLTDDFDLKSEFGDKPGSAGVVQSAPNEMLKDGDIGLSGEDMLNIKEQLS